MTFDPTYRGHMKNRLFDTIPFYPAYFLKVGALKCLNSVSILTVDWVCQVIPKTSRPSRQVEPNCLNLLS